MRISKKTKKFNRIKEQTDTKHALSVVDRPKNICKGIKPDESPCTNEAIYGTNFCFFHDKARIPYQQPGNRGVTIRHHGTISYSTLKSELERMNAKAPRPKKKKNQNHHDINQLPAAYSGKSNNRHGDLTEGEAAFDEFFDGEVFDEMPGTDSGYLDSFYTDTPSETRLVKRNHDKQSSFSYGYNDYKDDYANDYRGSDSKKSKWKWEPTPVITLKPCQRRLIDRISHMEYWVMRGTNGKYYAVYMSRKANGFMGNHHFSKPHYTFSGAENEFHGHESLWRIRERIKKATDPDYIPPNLRKLAANNMWKEMYAGMGKAAWEKYYPILLKWAKDGFVGWYGTISSYYKSKQWKRLR